MISDAQKRATNKYRNANYEQISFRIKKGKRQFYNQLADSKGVPLSNMIVDYLEEECKKAGINTDGKIQ